MAAHMGFEVAWFTESGIALRALERPFSGMNSGVRLQVSRLTESGTTVRTDVWFGMTAPMPEKCSPFAKAGAADFALMYLNRFWAGSNNR